MEDAELKIATFAGRYFTDGAQVPFERAPYTNAGLTTDRMQSEPPPDFVDRESMLRGSFDIIGKYGFQHTASEKETEMLQRARAQPPPQTPPALQKPQPFVNEPIDDRYIRKTCYDDTRSFYRFDVAPPENRFPLNLGDHRGGLNTRLDAKDAFETCKRQ